MFAAGVALLGALVTMGLTDYRQEAYYNLTIDEMCNEVPLYFGKDWPESFRGPELKFFQFPLENGQADREAGSQGQAQVQGRPTGK